MRASCNFGIQRHCCRVAALPRRCGLPLPQASSQPSLFKHPLHIHHHQHVAMNNSLGPKKNTRNTQKCSACRQRKKKVRESGRDLSETVGQEEPMTNSLQFSQCSPNNRDWENRQQKCDHCETRDLPCGPNLRYSVDRAIRRRAAVPEDENVVGSNPATEQSRGHPDGLATSSEPDISAPATCRTQEWNDGPPNPNGEDGRQPFGASSVKKLEEKATSK